MADDNVVISELRAAVNAARDSAESAAREARQIQEEYFDRRFDELLAGIPSGRGGRHLLNSMSSTGEASVVHMAAFLMSRCEFNYPGIPFTEHDKVVFEMALQRSRADIVIFHVDGSVTVIEAKDGSAGYRSVVAGIGQVGYYATMIGAQSTGMKVRRALLWSSVGSKDEDERIALACELSGVVPVLVGQPKDYHSRLFNAMAEAVKREIDARRVSVYLGLSKGDVSLLSEFGLMPAVFGVDA